MQVGSLHFETKDLSRQKINSNKYPKVLFRVDANNKVGWGHFYRSLALAEMLDDKFSIVFAVADPAISIRQEIIKRKFQLVELQHQDYTTPDERGKKELSFDLNGQLDEIDVVVLDGYWFATNYQKELRKNPVKIVVIEDDGGGEYIADLVINHAPGISKKSYQIENKEVLFALGTDYALLRPNFLAAARSEYSTKYALENVLVSFGGSDYSNFTCPVVAWLLENTEVRLHVVLGAGYQHDSELQEIVKHKPDRVKLSKSMDEEQMVNAMCKADAAVLSASGILFESIACRLPAISGTSAKNQMAIYKGLLKKDVIFDGGDFSDLSMAWRKLINAELDSIRKRQTSIIDGYSPERIKKLFQCLL